MMRLIPLDPDKGYIDNSLSVPKDAVNVEGVKNALTYTLEDKLGHVRYEEMYEETETHLVVPRAFWDPRDMDFETVDLRPREYEEIEVTSKIVLDAKNPHRTTQQEALSAIMANMGGILQLACGLGKSVVALEAVARFRVPTLIVVNNTNLMKQWEAEIERHLDLPEGVGRIQGTTFDWQKPVVLSTYQTLMRRAEDLPEEVRRWFGFMIFDEAHHVAAPVFCKTADLTYGYRLGLTATPDRSDGGQVIYNFHIGKVIYKDLKQELTPSFEFIWTGVEVDMEDKQVRAQVVDKRDELHLSRLASYLGRRKDRLRKVLDLVEQHEAVGRKTLILSTSVAELVNLLALYNGEKDLYSDIPEPTPKEFNAEGLEPKAISKKARTRYELELKRCELALYDANIPAVKKEKIKDKMIPLIRKKLDRDDLAKKITKETKSRQRKYIKKEIDKNSSAGLMVAKVPPALRMKMLKTRQTVFAIYQYGLEGLDHEDLDTVIACEPLTSKGPIQQFMGRILRTAGHKNKKPLVQFLEDNIGVIIGMCKLVRRQLREWPTDEGGPFQYTLVGHPSEVRRAQWLKKRKIGQSSFLAGTSS